MLDPILDARMSALEQKLKCVTRNPSQQWGPQLDLVMLDIEEDIWIGIDRTIGKEVQNHLREISDLREALRDDTNSKSNADAWREYTEVYEHSQETFREWLDLFGGLVLRQKRLDQNLCDVADTLIVRLARESTVSRTLSIPAAREALAVTLARTIRLRFPEPTIWDLPFTAHEYGHVVVSENDEIRKHVKVTAARWADQDLESNLVAEDQKEQTEERYKHHLEDFVADSYATHAMGPSFACAAVFLRFSPSRAYDETEYNAAYAKRARVIFAMLERMNDEASGNPYRDVIEQLKGWWEAMLEQVEPSRGLTEADEGRLKDLVRDIWDRLEAEFVGLTLYPYRGKSNDGWLVAQAKSDSWNEELENLFQDLTDDDDRMLQPSNIRDLLNAAWLSRIDLTDPNDPETKYKIDKVAKAAYGQCKRIVEASRYRSSGAPPDSLSQPSPGR